MLTAWEWAKAEFGGAELGDPRRTRRLVKVVEALAQDPHGALHRVLSDWTELMGAYRLVGSSAVSFDRVPSGIPGVPKDGLRRWRSKSWRFVRFIHPPESNRWFGSC